MKMFAGDPCNYIDGVAIGTTKEYDEYIALLLKPFRRVGYNIDSNIVNPDFIKYRKQGRGDWYLRPDGGATRIEEISVTVWIPVKDMFEE